jgi:hypothetical protein
MEQCSNLDLVDFEVTVPMPERIVGVVSESLDDLKFQVEISCHFHSEIIS